jgi:hypothetical protein
MKSNMTKKFIIGFLVASSLLFTCRGDDTPSPNPSFVYFLVGETTNANGDAYLLPLIDPSDIAQAREMISDPSTSKLILAEITKDIAINYYVNKDLLQGKTWSWHIASFMGFVDMTIEIYDGWPQYVEDHYEEWTNTTKGPNGNPIIGFWNYTIIREVDKSEL